MSEISTKPYLLRAIHEWCSDSGFTPYIAVSVDEHTVVPADFVRAGEIVLNISLSATNRLSIGNELIEFQARFGGMAQELSIPVDNVSAIYARENGHGMAFEVAKPLAVPELPETLDGSNPQATDEPAGEIPTNTRPALSAVPKLKPQAEDSADAATAGTEADAGLDETAPVADEADLADAESVGDASKQPDAATDSPDGDDEPPPKRRGKPKLTRVK
jgi:stringent starvation protein B